MMQKTMTIRGDLTQTGDIYKLVNILSDAGLNRIRIAECLEQSARDMRFIEEVLNDESI